MKIFKIIFGLIGLSLLGLSAFLYISNPDISLTFIAIIGFIGSVFSLIAGAIAMVGFLGKRNASELLKNGYPVDAKIQDIELNQALEINGKNPYRIVAHWINPATDELHIFKSKNLWFNPADYIQKETVTVYVDSPDASLKKHHMDVSFLPKIAD